MTFHREWPTRSKQYKLSLHKYLSLCRLNDEKIRYLVGIDIFTIWLILTETVHLKYTCIIMVLYQYYFMFTKEHNCPQKIVKWNRQRFGGSTVVEHISNIIRSRVRVQLQETKWEKTKIGTNFMTFKSLIISSENVVLKL